MSLSARDQQALDDIAEGLVGSAPKLAAMLATFARLTSGEEMPADDEVGVVRPDAHGVRLQSRRSVFRHVVPVLWILVAIALIGITIAVSRSANGDACVRSWSVACAGPVPSRSARPARKATPKTAPTAAAGQAPPAAVQPSPPAARPPETRTGDLYRGTI